MTLEERIASLEQSNRMLKMVTLVTVVAVVAVGIWMILRSSSTHPAESNKTLRVQNIEIVDAEGNVRAELGVVGKKRDQYGLSLRTGGKDVALLSTNDKAGETGLSLRPDDGEPEGVPDAYLGVNADGRYDFRVGGKEKGGVSVVPYEDRGGAVLTLKGVSSSLRQLILWTDSEGPRIVLIDSKGERKHIPAK